MTSKTTSLVDVPVGQTTIPLVGASLLDEIKRSMIGDASISLAGEAIFRTMFGNTGDRIYTQSLPSYNDTKVPLLELMWSRERFDNWDTEMSGSILGRIVLPVSLRGDFQKLRSVAQLLVRFFGAGQHKLFQRVSGLTEVGAGMEFQYDQLLAVNALVFPVITFTLPFKFDLYLFSQQNPGFDVHGHLDDPLLGNMESYAIQITSEEGDVLITEGTLSNTGQTNG